MRCELFYIIKVFFFGVNKVTRIGDAVNVERYLVTAMEELYAGMQVLHVDEFQVRCVARCGLPTLQ